MSRLLPQFGPDFDVTRFDARTAELIAREAFVDVGKCERLRLAWDEQPDRPNWAVELVAQALSGFMMVAGVWKVPAPAEAAQAEDAAGAARGAVERASKYASALATAVDNAAIEREYKADPAAFAAKPAETTARLERGSAAVSAFLSRERRRKSPPGSPETAVPGTLLENLTADRRGDSMPLAIADGPPFIPEGAPELPEGQRYTQSTYPIQGRERHLILRAISRQGRVVDQQLVGHWPAVEESEIPKPFDRPPAKPLDVEAPKTTDEASKEMATAPRGVPVGEVPPIPAAENKAFDKPGETITAPTGEGQATVAPPGEPG